MTKTLELGLLELRFRMDFVVIRQGERNQACDPRRTPPLTLWEAWEWCKTFRDQDPEGIYEIEGATKQALKVQEQRAAGVGLLN